MGLFNEQQKKEINKALALIKAPVWISFFTGNTGCNYCAITGHILEELSGLSPMIKVSTYDIAADPEKALELKIDKVPAIVIHRGNGHGVRFFGVPAGYEFQALLNDIIMAGNNESPLSLATILEIARISTPVHIEVMVSPSCPYCSSAVNAAHKFSMANPNITADMVEISEFPDIAAKYGVKGVPHTVINGKHSLVGSIQELDLAKELNRLIG